MGIEEQIAANKRTTFILFSGLILIMMVVAGFTIYYHDVGIGVGIIIFTVFYMVYNYRAANKNIVRLTKARRVSRQSHRRLYLTVENYSIQLGIPTPEVYLIADRRLNAFAAGVNPKKAIVGVTEGLLENLDRQELEAVLAHEMSHIVNRDVRVATLAFVIVGGLVVLVEASLRVRSDNSRSHAAALLIGIVAGILAIILAQFVQMAISRRREYLADANAIQISKYPVGLINALEKIKLQGSHLKDMKSSTNHFFLAPTTAKPGFLKRIFSLSSHPPIGDRIKRLRQMEASGY